MKKLAEEVQKNAAKTAMIVPSGKAEDTHLEHPDLDADSPAGAQATGQQTAQRAEAARRRRYGLAADEDRLSDPRTRSPGARDEDGEDRDFDVHGFDHPSTYAPQPWIWVPRDALGLSAVLVREYRAAGVDADDEGAEMDCKGGVEVSRGPPDEEWAGGCDA